ncbi:hypothetical protein AAHA92_15776 [Salvia divinorum]|uniref:CCHC-type domain-containing protein n=1 Tax=Salvia divinorum TaxID=28513 RepID=A0ABD1HFT3_SALDI
MRDKFGIHFHHGGSIVKDGGLELYVGGDIAPKVACQKCLQQGHNSRSCKNNLVPKPTKEKGKRGRPRKVRQAQAQLGEAPSSLATQQSQV